MQIDQVIPAYLQKSSRCLLRLKQLGGALTHPLEKVRAA